MGIDIRKMHEEIESLKSQLYTAQLNEKAVEKDLYELRDRMFAAAVEIDKSGTVT